jgi:drug/metabolite transporter (DMT)-like permease
MLSLGTPTIRFNESSAPFAQKGVDKRIVVAAAFAIITWASAFPLIKMVLNNYSPEHFAVLRYMVAAVTLFAMARPRKVPTIPDALKFLLCGGLGVTVYNLALAYGELRVPSGVASLLVSTSPIFTAVFAVMLLKEKMSRAGVIGLGLGFVGAMLIACSGGMGGFDLSAAAILLAAVIQGLYVVLLKPLLVKYSIGESATYVALGAFLPLSFLLPQACVHAAQAPLQSTLGLLYLGVVPAAIGSLAWGAILSKLPASTAGSLLYLVPVISCALAALWLGEQPNVVSFIGAAIAACGVKFVTASKNKR